MADQFLVIMKKDDEWSLYSEEYKDRQIPLEGEFETAADILEAANIAYPDSWIDCKIDDSYGFLMSAEEWIEEVKNGGFIDYDGYGDMLIGDTLIGQTISPSRYATMPEEVTHILWYNR